MSMNLPEKKHCCLETTLILTNYVTKRKQMLERNLMKKNSHLREAKSKTVRLPQ